MTITSRAVPLLHRKEWQMMTPAPVATAAGAFVIHDNADADNLALLVSSATVHYLYHHDEDAWVQIPSGALGGTFGVGACGARGRWSATITANGGSTSTITTTGAITSLCIGKTVRFLTGSNIGEERPVTGVILNATGGTSTIQLGGSALPNATSNGDTLVVDTGRFFVMSAGAVGATSFRAYDPLSTAWASLTQTGLPASWGTDGKMVTTPSHFAHATGTASSGGATTLTVAGKNWTVNQWTNYQLRITGGLGAGQVRTIASNTATVLTVAAWATQPDATSTYSIEGNDDFIYLLGNNAVTMYRYSISGNSWSTLAPGSARPAAPAVGMSANWLANTGDTNWANEDDHRDGRFIYSFRGGAGNAIDRYDLALNTWSAVSAYGPLAEVFGSGSGYDASGRYIFVRKDATNRFFKFSVRGQMLEPLSTNTYPDGAAIAGDKIWIMELPDGDGVRWLYSLQNTGVALHRVMLIE